MHRVEEVNNYLELYHESHYHQTVVEHLPPDEAEHGRGLCILYEVFDRVCWNQGGTQVQLSKMVKTSKLKQPSLANLK